MYDHALTWSVEPASACSLLKTRLPVSPVDRTLDRDEGGGLRITDEGVVLDLHGIEPCGFGTAATVQPRADRT